LWPWALQLDDVPKSWEDLGKNWISPGKHGKFTRKHWIYQRLVEISVTKIGCRYFGCIPMNFVSEIGWKGKMRYGSSVCGTP